VGWRIVGRNRELSRGTRRQGVGAIVTVTSVVFLTLTSAFAPGRSETTGSLGGAAATGSLRGTVTVGPELNARKVHFSLYPDLHSTANPGSFKNEEEISNVVIYLESHGPAPSQTSSPARALRMEQRHESFIPHVLPILKGSTVEFPNVDPIYHNVFSLSKAASFDLGRYPSGTSRFVRFEEPGMVRVFCHIHADMSAVIIVLDGPFFTSPDPGGSFEIRDVPPGTYTVNAWHERARPIRRQVIIRPGEATEMKLDIPLRDKPVGE